MPEKAAELARAEVAHALADFVARPDPERAGRHLPVISGDYRVPLGADRFAMLADISYLPQTDDLLFKVRAIISYDGGKTWWQDENGKTLPLMAFARNGQVTYDDEGRPDTQCGVAGGWKLPQPDNPDRVVRIELIPFADIKTEVQIMFRSSREGR